MDERPLCDCCDTPITDDHYYAINGEAICIHCMNEYFRQDLPDEEDGEDDDEPGQD